MQNYNPEQIMLSAVVRRPSRDINIMKEKLIFSGAAQIPVTVFKFIIKLFGVWNTFTASYNVS